MTASDQSRDVISVLVEDHREVARLFERIDEVPIGGAQRGHLVDRAIAELVRHMVVEEQYLYPAVRKHVPGGDAIADKEIADHAAAERTMRDLVGVPVDDERFDPLTSRLMAEVRHHVQDEEQTVFPLLAGSCSAQELAELGRKVQAAKRLAPTRPHPRAPDKPPMNMLVALWVGLADRIRDSVTGRQTGA